MYKSLIHFEFTFVSGVKHRSSLIGLYVIIQFSLHYLLKRLSFPHLVVMSFLPNIGQLYAQGLFLVTQFSPIGIMFMFFVQSPSHVWLFATLWTAACQYVYVYLYANNTLLLITVSV